MPANIQKWMKQGCTNTHPRRIAGPRNSILKYPQNACNHPPIKTNRCQLQIQKLSCVIGLTQPSISFTSFPSRSRTPRILPLSPLPHNAHEPANSVYCKSSLRSVPNIRTILSLYPADRSSRKTTRRKSRWRTCSSCDLGCSSRPLSNR